MRGVEFQNINFGLSCQEVGTVSAKSSPLRLVSRAITGEFVPLNGTLMDSALIGHNKTDSSVNIKCQLNQDRRPFSLVYLCLTFFLIKLNQDGISSGRLAKVV